MKIKDIETQIKILFDYWFDEKSKQKLEKVRYAGPVLGKEEYSGMLDAIFDDWWSGGKYTLETEEKLAKISDRNHGLFVNSGSSADLLLMSAAKELYFEDGDKILTLACGFPTTVNPIIQNRLIPVFVDIDLNEMSLNPDLLQEVLKKDKKIKGVFFAHTLGFVGDIDRILNIARENNVQVFFDSCDAYSSTYKGKPVQAYGKASTFSFYPAHHCTSGEGGGIVTNDSELFTVMRSFRGWGRWCASSNCCIRSVKPELFCPTQKFSKCTEMPDDYSVNYTYEFLGYNLKPLELQAKILFHQLDRLEHFHNIRVKNYNKLYDYFVKKNIPDIKLWKLEHNVCPFSFPILLSENINRKHLIGHLSRRGIESRLLFGGNLIKQPAYAKKKQYWETYGSFENSDKIMNKFIMLGVSQINDDSHIDKVITEVDNFLSIGI